MSNSNLAVVGRNLAAPAASLAPAPRQDAITFTAEQLAVLQETYFKGCTPIEIDLAMAVCKATGLDPFLKQIVFIKRWDANAPRQGGGNGKYVLTAQPTIDGVRVMAQRSGRYAGQDGPFYCGPDGVWSELWLDEERPPVAAKVTVYAAGSNRGYTAVCMWNEYRVQHKNKAGEVYLGEFWRKMPALMLGKCAESLALRKAFPAEYSQFAPAPGNREIAEQVEAEIVQNTVEHDGLQWDADTGVLMEDGEASPDIEPDPNASLMRVHAIAREKKIGTVDLHSLLYAKFHIESLRDASETQLRQFGDYLDKTDRDVLQKAWRATEAMKAKAQSAPDRAETPEDDAIDAEYSDVTDDATASESGGTAAEYDTQDIGALVIAEKIAALDAAETLEAFYAVGRSVSDAGIWDARIIDAQARNLRRLKSGA